MTFPLPLRSPLWRRASRVVERDLLVYRRIWWVLVSGLVEAPLYLLSLGFGVGALVGTLTANGHRVSYASFVAPALMASAAMSGALVDSTFNLFEEIRYLRIYDSVLGTPLDVINIVLGENAWAVLRGLIYAIPFGVLMALLQLTSVSAALLAIPVASFVSFAFAGSGCFAMTFAFRWEDLEFIELARMPVFLFSATFYPVSLYPGPLRVLAELSPLTRGVDLMRSLTLHSLGWNMAIDAAYLLAVGTIGLVAASRRLSRQLRT
jgi:lipooligosaccharide transport system permease protein